MKLLATLVAALTLAARGQESPYFLRHVANLNEGDEDVVVPEAAGPEGAAPCHKSDIFFGSTYTTWDCQADDSLKRTIFADDACTSYLLDFTYPAGSTEPFTGQPRFSCAGAVQYAEVAVFAYTTGTPDCAGTPHGNLTLAVGNCLASQQTATQGGTTYDLWEKLECDGDGLTRTYYLDSTCDTELRVDVFGDDDCGELGRIDDSGRFFALHANFLQCSSPLTCDGASFDWAEIQANDSASGWVSASVAQSPSAAVALDVVVDAEYVGTAVDTTPGSSYDNLGSTWVIAFAQFDLWRDHIYEPKICENRLAADFAATPSQAEWESFWDFSATPYLDIGAGDGTNLAYPPTNGTNWEIGMADAGATCSPVRWAATFSFNDLLACTDGNGDRALALADDGTFITLRGTLYVSLLGTFHGRDQPEAGVYRAREFASQDFEFRIRKMLEVVDAEGLRLFSTAVLAVSMEDADDGEEHEQRFSLVVVTTAPVFLTLTTVSLIGDPGTADVSFTAAASPLTSGCLLGSTYTCTQLWQVTGDVNTTACDDANDTVSFTGTYELAFGRECNPLNDAAQNASCATYLGAYPDLVDLSQFLDFADNDCDVARFDVQLEATMTFFTDGSFDDSPRRLQGAAETPRFVVGEPIFVQVDVDDRTMSSEDGYSVLDVALTSVWVCTANTTLEITDSQFGDGLEGCFAADVDNRLAEPILEGGSPPAEFHDVNYAYECGQSCVRFSFTAPALPRETIHVHALLTVGLVEEELGGDSTPRRRRLQASRGGDTMHHLLGAVEVAQAGNGGEVEDDGASEGGRGAEDGDDTLVYVLTAVGALLALAALAVAFHARRHGKWCWSDVEMQMTMSIDAVAKEKGTTLDVAA